MTEYDITTYVPATVYVKIKVKAKNKREAEVLARRYIRRASDDTYEEKGWDGCIDDEEMPKFEIEEVDCRKMDFQTTDWKKVPVTFIGDDGEWKQLPYKVFWKMKHKQWAEDAAKKGK